MIGLHRQLQGRSSVRSERADGGERDLQDLGGLVAAKVEEIEEHERGALTLRKFAEGSDDLVAKIGGRERVLGFTGTQ